MGWDGTPVGRNIKTLDYLTFEYNKQSNWTVVAAGQGQRRGGESVYYHAIQNQKGEVFAVVTLVKRNNGWLYKKTMGEDEGPGQSDCPRKVFEALTPTTSQWANEWRERVAERLANPQPKVKAGDFIKFAEPIIFANGESRDLFRYEGRSKFRGVDTTGVFGHYQITNWKLKKYEIARVEELV